MTDAIIGIAQDKRWSDGNMTQPAARGRYHLRKLMARRGLQAAGIQRNPGTTTHQRSHLAFGAVMHTRRADLTAAFHAAAPGCHNAGSEKSAACNKGQGKADGLQHDRSGSCAILIHSVG